MLKNSIIINCVIAIAAIAAIAILNYNPLTVVAHNVEYAESVNNVPGLKMQIMISGSRSPWNTKQLILDVMFDDETRPIWTFAPNLEIKEILATGEVVNRDMKINLVSNYEYTSTIEFQNFKDGKEYQLTIFFNPYSKEYFQDIRQFHQTKDETTKKQIIEKYQKFAEKSQKSIVARNSIQIKIHEN